MEDVTRLPKWAQSRIMQLEQNLEHARKNQATMLGGSLVGKERMEATGPSVIIEPYAEQPILLRPQTHVAFKMGDRWDTEIRICMKDGYLDINATRSINIRPNASNSCFIALADR